MTLPSLNYFQAVKLTLALKTAPATTKTVYCTNRVNKQATADGTIYWPILDNVSEFGAAMDEFLPKPYSGSFTLDNTIGTFGEGRKFGDLLERYSIIDQLVEIHLDAVAYESETFAIDSNSRAWIAKVASVDSGFDEERATLTFNLTQDVIPDRQLCCMVSEETLPLVTGSILGKWMPIAAGEYNYLPAYYLGDTPGTPYYAFATTLGSDFKHSVYTALSQDVDGEWCEIAQSAPRATTDDGGTSGYSLDPSTTPEWIFDMPVVSAVNDLIACMSVRFSSNGSGGRTSTCILTFTIHEIGKTTNLPTGRKLTSATLDLSDYDTENNGDPYFDANIRFERAATLNYDKFKYGIGVSAVGWAAGEASWRMVNSGTVLQWKRNAEGNYEPQGLQLAPVVEVSYTTFGLLFGYADPDSSGKSVNLLIVDEWTLAPLDNYASLDLIVKTHGLTDVDGTITGVADAPIVRPDHFIKILSSTSADGGATWDASTDWDWTTYADAYTANYTTTGEHPRLLLGYQDAPVTFREMLQAVCRDSASRIGVTAAGKLFLWPWGSTQAVTYTIPPEDIVPKNWTIGDPSSVINRVRLTYGVTNVDVAALKNKKQKSNYTGTYDKSTAFAGYAQATVTSSVAAYGTRELEISETEYIGDSVSAQTVCDYYFIRYSQPLILAEIEVPYHKYSAVQLLQTISFSHPAFPKHQGAYTRHSDLIVSNSDATQAFVKGGRHWHSSKWWRGQIEGWAVETPKGEAPRLKLQLRVLPNFPIDPT